DLRARRPEATHAAAPDRRAGLSAGGGELRRAGRPLVVGRPRAEAVRVIRKLVRFLDRRTGTAPFAQKFLRYLFPDHWSFLLGEVALYSFIVLVATGTFLALFFEPSLSDTVYRGSYEPLQGATMSHAYKSAVGLSFDVRAGLLMRQTHHWAADIFMAA